MIDDFYMIAITALLPLTAGLLVVQVNPYHALVIRGILGAIAALIYALFGAADVALTEALVGTMLSITLYAVAVRSSMTVRIGVVEESVEEIVEGSLEEIAEKSVEAVAKEHAEETEKKRVENSVAATTDAATTDGIAQAPKLDAKQLLSALSPALSKYHVRLELFTYANPLDLTAALAKKEIHIAYGTADSTADGTAAALQTRIQRLYGILKNGLPPTLALNYFAPTGMSLPEPSQPATSSNISKRSRSQS